jgi:Reverse transcriptase (RNA-dependent DNA polymerase)
MHYALDLWVHQWRKRNAHGRVIIVRYCDDFVMGFQYEADARQMLVHLRERLAKFKLTLHEQKTRLIEFGKLVSELRKKRGAERCETVRFLGFMHYCAWSRDGRFGSCAAPTTSGLRESSKNYGWRRGGGCTRRLSCSISSCAAFYADTFHILVCRAILTGSMLSIEKPVAFGIGRSIAAASDGSRGSATSGCSNVFPCQLPTSPILDRWSLADLDKPQEEPSARKPPARICEGEAKWLNYSTTTPAVMLLNQVSTRLPFRGGFSCHTSPITDRGC